MKKTIKELLEGLDFSIIRGSLDTQINGISYDSRVIEDGNLFVAVPGLIVDGHDYIDQVVSAGADCIIVEKEIEIKHNVTIIKVKDSRRALALIAANYYGKPSKKMKVVGITGTNGKTTTIHILKSIYENLDFKVGLIGTIGASVRNEKIDCKNTTPESVDLQRIFAFMARENADYCFIEVSSHALGLNRVAGTFFSSGIYTNLSPDHLEFHKDMEEYFQTKKKLFHMTEKYNIINCDDLYGKRLIKLLSSEEPGMIKYGIDCDADIYAEDISYLLDSSEFSLVTPKGKIDIRLNLPGKVNVYNCLAAVSYAYADGIGIEEIAHGIESFKGVKGRFENVYHDEDFDVIVDFAHTEDGLKQALETVRPFIKGKIILVFGVYAAPGEKGRDKRLAMGRMAAKYADYSIITSDNPKNQNPQEIINEIIEGMKENSQNFKSYIDRKDAISEAIKMVKKGDLVLITGKGHETAQLVGDKAVPFNEKEIVLNEISKIRIRQVKNEQD